MLTSEDYKQMAYRSAQIAIECSVPSVAAALMALASDYVERAATLGQPNVSPQHRKLQDSADGFGD